MELSNNLKNYKKVGDLWETLTPLEFYKKTQLITDIIPSKINHVPDFKAWRPVLTTLHVPIGTKVDLVITKNKIISCRLETAFVKQQRILDGFTETELISKSNSFYDDTFIYETNSTLIQELNENNGIYAYTTILNAKCH
jgi:hypothetical protein